MDAKKIAMLIELLNTVEHTLKAASDLEPIVKGFRELLETELAELN